MNNQIHSETSIGWLNSLTTGVRRAVKTFGFTALLVGFGLALTNTAQAQLSVGDALWKVEAGSVAWLSDAGNQVRGAAFNPATGNILVASRAGGVNRIEVVNAATGVSSGTLTSPVGGFTGGILPLNRIAVTDDGQIFASNLILDTGLNYTVYYWANEAATPVVLFTGNPSPDARYGDGIGVTGTGNDVTFYAGGTFTPGFAKFSFNGTQFAETIEYVDLGDDYANANIIAVPGTDYLWIGSRDNEIIKYNAALDSIVAVIPYSVVPASFGDIDYAVVDGREILVAGVQGVEMANFLLVDVTDAQNAYVFAQTGSIGFGENNFRVGAVSFNGDGSEIYVLATNTALAAYNIETAVATELVNVTFTLNTATIPDTVRAGDFRFTVNGAIKGALGGQAFVDGETIDWGSSATAELNNIGGDYWSNTFRMVKGDTILYKYRWDVPGTSRTADEKGFAESENPAGWDTRGIVATSDIVLPVEYWNNTDGKPSQINQAPFVSAIDSIALFFRVNVGAQIATGSFNPATDVVGVRGNPVFDWGTTNLVLSPENMPEGSKNAMYSGAIYVPESMAGSDFKFKYVYGTADNINTGSITWDSGADAFNPDGDGNNQAMIGTADTTYAFKFFDGRRPPEADIVAASVQFAVNVGVLEELGYFNRSLGDRVSVPGAFNSWNTGAEMVYSEAFNAWTTAYTITEEVGATIQYKYYIDWDDSRTDNTSPNYIPGLPGGWEEPGATGGGNRAYVFTNETEQSTDDFGSGVSFYNNIPPQGVIRTTIDNETSLPVKFVIDMAPALAHSTPFDPANDKVYLVLETPVFALTQGLPIGDGDLFDNPEHLPTVEFTKTDAAGHIYELVLDLSLPTENHIGFKIAYVKPGETGERIVNGDGFDAGRRYYRYIEPLDASDSEDIIWPNSAELNPIEWKWRNLDFEVPPSYGLEDVSIDRNDLLTPGNYVLHQNYPNPFNPTTRISFTIPMTDNVQVDVFNVLGQRVATLVNGVMPAGTHTLTFNAASLASGVYIYRIQSGNFIQAKSMMLVK
jgi:hypothetical protein